MILAFDTYYQNEKAKTVCITFRKWADNTPVDAFVETKEDIEAYEPGHFFKRELPCISSLLGKINTKPIDAIVIDGYVYLDDERKPGLGAHLYNALQQRIPIIGVAKTNFRTIDQHKKEIFRGKSVRPLYITAAGVPLLQAAENVKSMAGDYRIPVLLKMLDTMTRTR